MPIDLMRIGTSINLAGVVYFDARDNKTVIIPLPGEDLTNVEILKLSLDEWKALIRQSDIVEIPNLTRDAEGKLAKGLLRKSGRQVSQHVSWNVFRRDGYSCRYCGTADKPLTVDHLVLWEEGGPSIEDNLLASCKKCNNTRGNMQYSDWLEDRFYKRVSKNLTDATKQANRDITSTLHKIPRQPRKSR